MEPYPHFLFRRLITTALPLFLVALAVCNIAAAPLDATLNGVNISIDPDTGSILRLSFPGPGTVLETTPQHAGMLDLAYPTARFEPLRLASRYSHNAKITVSSDLVTISWDKLGASRDFSLPGRVAAAVTLRAAPDHRSIIMSAEVKNDSSAPVRQVIFPDFAGLRPFAGATRTFFRTCGAISAPFVELAPTEDHASQQYMIDSAAYSAEYKAGGLFHSMVARWMDFGALSGGFSLFPKRWGWDPQVTTRLHLTETEQSLRLLCLHDATIPPGTNWSSGEFILTFHTNGWAKGIEPFRAWVRQNFKREQPMPKHVREGLGFRTAWMCQNQPDDPKDAVFTFADLPRLADDCKAHGLDEIVLWSWNRGFVLPLPPPFPHLGTEKEFASAVAQCREKGVNVVPFISILQANAETAPRYGLKVTDNNGWTYHTDLIPRWNPPYAAGFACVAIPTSNPLWQKDVLEGVKHLIDLGVTSLSWDQFWSTRETPNINTLATQIRAAAKAKDPESTFSGEELWNIDIDSAQLDYTWNWGGYRDLRALTSVYPAPRINCCITDSSLSVKKAFADNLYINASPRKPDSINGSDYIAPHKNFSAALKHCAALRKQFLPYFLDSTPIGDCILTEPCATAHISTYVMPDRILMIMVKDDGVGPVTFAANIGPWCSVPTDAYEVTIYREDGQRDRTIQTQSSWQHTTKALAAQEILLFEIRPH